MLWRIKNLVLMLLLVSYPALAQDRPASAGPADPQLIEDLVVANRILAAHRIFDAFGHVSVRHDRDPNRFLMSRSLAPELVIFDDLLEYNLDAAPIDLAGRSQYSERFIQAECVASRGLRPEFIFNPQLVYYSLNA